MSPVLFNPFTGSLDLVANSSGSGGVTVEQVIKAMLVQSDQTLEIPVVTLLADETSILYIDDGAL